MLCERCHENPATIHVTSILEGQSAVQNFCEKCYDDMFKSHPELAEELRKAEAEGRPGIIKSFPREFWPESLQKFLPEDEEGQQ